MNKITFIVFAIFGSSNGLPLEHTKIEFSEYFTARIVGGVIAPDNYAPYMVALLVGEDMVILNCGGSLMTPRLVLTAAHCIETFHIDGKLLPSFHAKVGTNDWTKGGEVAKFSGFDIHPDYDYENIKYDIGFLMLENKVTLNKRVTTIALNYDFVGGQKEGFVTGWGNIGRGVTPFKLQLLYVNTLAPKECDEGIRRAQQHWNRPIKLQHEIEICTFHSRGHGMCHGDSGSALVHAESGTQIGIASWAFACALGFPDIFVRVSGFRNYTETFINQYK